MTTKRHKTTKKRHKMTKYRQQRIWKLAGLVAFYISVLWGSLSIHDHNMRKFFLYIASKL